MAGIGIDIRTLQRIERGAHASPEALKCIASVRETDFENLWTEQEMPTVEEPKYPRLLAKIKRSHGICKWLKAFCMHLFVAAVVFTALSGINLSLSLGYFFLGRVWLGH